MTSDIPDSPAQTQTKTAVTNNVIVWLILVLGIILTATASQFTQALLEKDARDQFENTTRRISNSLLARLTSYEDLLRAMQGVFMASETVTREEFSLFLDNMLLPTRYPSILSVSYAARVADSARLAFEERVRRNPDLRYPEHTGFSIKSDVARPEYLPLIFLEPFGGLENAYGLDLMADAVRRMSVERARDSGLAVASGQYTLVAKAGAGQAASSLRLALYRKKTPAVTLAQRRDAFTGMLSVTFIIGELAGSALHGTHGEHMALRITDLGYAENASHGSPESEVLFDNKDNARLNFTGPVLEDSRMLSVGQRVWQLSFAAPQHAFSIPLARSLPWAIMLAGLLCTGLLCGLIRALSTAERRAVALATAMTQYLRKSEARLSEAQSMTQVLIEALPNPIFFKGTDGRYLGVNKAWEEYFGTPRESFIGKTVHDLYPNNRDVADRLHAMDQVLWDNPGRQVYETLITTPDGLRHDAIYCKATFTGTDGKVSGLIGTIIDITERKQAEQRYQAIFDNAAVGITRVDLDGILRHANQKFFDMLGYSRDELIGTSIKDITHPDDYGQGAQFRSQISANILKTASTEKRFIHKSGDVIWVRRTISVALGKDGQPEYLVSVVEDITDRKMTEQRQSMEHAVTRVLAEAETLNEAIPRIIQTICETLDWQCGSRWEWVAETQMLYCRECWSIDVPEIRDFIFSSLGRTTHTKKPGSGLVRAAFSSGQPVWITDIALERGFVRAPMVAKAGLHGAIAFPLMLGNEILGVMEFFHREVRPPDDAMLRIARSIGSQIGQYMVRQKAEDAVKFVATHDALTGLPNRVLFNERLSHSVAQARRYDRRLAVMFIDLDRFKNINDTLGHDAGDQLLIEVARRITGCLREGDTVCRQGGDEFVVLAEEINTPVTLGSLAQKLISALGKGYMLSGREFHVTASIGISTYPDDGLDASTLLKNADIAMYRAKDQGRNAFQFYSAQMNTHSEERLSLESGLRYALEREELVLHYQPQIDVMTGTITGMEALVRWQHPEFGLMPPGKFIQIAEETGLIVPIGEWVLHTACAAQRNWMAQGLQPVRMAVNLSPRQFTNENLLQEVMHSLRQSSVDLSLVELGITESTVMRDPERAIMIIRQLKDMGVRIAIDDFGTGYSALAHLKYFPIDSLKIDRIFVKDIPNVPSDMAIVTALIAMAHTLNMSVIAEGVETEAQYNFLRSRHCDDAQGYYFSKPVPENEAAALLRGKRPLISRSA